MSTSPPPPPSLFAASRRYAITNLALALGLLSAVGVVLGLGAGVFYVAAGFGLLAISCPVLFVGVLGLVLVALLPTAIAQIVDPTRVRALGLAGETRSEREKSLDALQETLSKAGAARIALHKGEAIISDGWVAITAGHNLLVAQRSAVEQARLETRRRKLLGMTYRTTLEMRLVRRGMSAPDVFAFPIQDHDACLTLLESLGLHALDAAELGAAQHFSRPAK